MLANIRSIFSVRLTIDFAGTGSDQPREDIEGLLSLLNSLAGEGTVLQLDAIAWTGAFQLVEAAKCPEHFEIDATAKTNNEQRPLVFVTGADAFGKSVRWLSALPTAERTIDFAWVCSTAMPALLGDILEGVHVALSDGATPITTAIDNLLSTLGGKAKRLLCYWHTVTSFLADVFGVIEDGEVQEKIRHKFRCMQSAESEEAFERHRAAAFQHLQESGASGAQRQVVQDQMDKILAKAHHWALFHHPGLRTIGCTTTSRGEGENATHKKSANIHNAARLWATLEQDVDLQEYRQARNRARVIRASAQLTDKDNLLRPISGDVTPLALSLVTKQLEASKDYSVQPLFEDGCVRFKVTRKPKSGALPYPPRSVQLDSSGFLVCPCPVWRQSLIPCRHTIAVNQGQVRLGDFHFRWWNTVACGQHLKERRHGDGAVGPGFCGDKVGTHSCVLEMLVKLTRGLSGCHSHIRASNAGN